MEHQRRFLVGWYRRELIKESYDHAVTTLCACATSMSTQQSAQRVTPAAETHLSRRTGRNAPDPDQAAGPGHMTTEPHAWESRRSVHVHH
jgi:hypothetical protein